MVRLMEALFVSKVARRGMKKSLLEVLKIGERGGEWTAPGPPAVSGLKVAGGGLSAPVTGETVTAILEARALVCYASVTHSFL